MVIHSITIKQKSGGTLSFRIFVDNARTAEQVVETFADNAEWIVSRDINGASMLYTSAIDAIFAIEDSLIDARKK